jgi:predicted nucleotidyltransferase/DNA-binding XRE family transcriptional regulator
MSEPASAVTGKSRDARSRAATRSSSQRASFQDQLVAARRAARLTQAELGARIGTTQSAIARLESGTISPTVETLSRLADAVGLRFEIAPNSGLTAHDSKGKKPSLQELRASRGEILDTAARYGARNIRIFGSVARGDADATSDVDILLDIVADVHGFAYFGHLEDLRRALTDLIGYDVDIVDSAGLREMRERVVEAAVPL